MIRQLIPLAALLSGIAPGAPELPPIDLPAGFVAEVVAAPPLVRHPLMAALDDRGRLFVSEAAGRNLNREDLERELPNFIRMLEDTDADGIFDRSTIFADKMTFPQGALWLDGSLYVGSPPSIWKLTDLDDDGVADQREEIATGFGFTGNAASIHGPFLHPNGRLFWCHGRKDHHVTRKDGTFYSSGLGARIWSCNPDGSDLEAWAGGGLDNPVELDFTAEGELVGSVNLFYGRPRGDVLVHWLRGGKYPRLDQPGVLREFKSTGPILREAHNFGHVAVSGMCLARGPHFRAGQPDHLAALTTHFNTQEVTRTTLAWEGATLASRRNETILRIHQPDVHLTDVMELADGSLLLIDTGGWFRIGCPTSQLAKPEIPGAIYRIRPDGRRTPVRGRPRLPRPEDPETSAGLIAQLEAAPRTARRAAEALGKRRDADAIVPLVRLLATRPERALEHNLLWALIEIDQFDATRDALARHPAAMPAGLWALDQMPSSVLQEEMVLPWLGKGTTALRVIQGHPDWSEGVPEWLWEETRRHKGPLPPALREAITTTAPERIGHPAVRRLITLLLEGDPDSRSLALEVLAGLPAPVDPSDPWLPKLEQLFATDDESSLRAVLKATHNLDAPELHTRLHTLASQDRWTPLTRVLALRAGRRDAAPRADEFALLLALVGPEASPLDRSTAVALLNASALDNEQLVRLAAALPDSGPVEFPGLLSCFSRSRAPEVGSALARAIATAPAAASVPPSELASHLSRYPEESVSLARPRLAELDQLAVERREQLTRLSAQVASRGNPQRGARLFAEGAGACRTCHLVGDVGIDLGPNLSTIGRIRQPADLLESILFPNASLARDFEAYLVEQRDGPTILGLVRHETADSLTLALPGGVTMRLARADIQSFRPAPLSLMPMGLESSLAEQELLDLVAYLDSLH